MLDVCRFHQVQHVYDILVGRSDVGFDKDKKICVDIFPNQHLFDLWIAAEFPISNVVAMVDVWVWVSGYQDHEGGEWQPVFGIGSVRIIFGQF